MRLQNIIQFYLSGKSYQELARKMGYGNVFKGAQRISRVVNDPSLGLRQAEYDFRYENNSFVTALCRALEIPPKKYLPELAILHSEIEKEKIQFQPYLFIKTDFNINKRRPPIFALSFTNHWRYIELPFYTKSLPLQTLPHVVKKTITSHFRQKEGKLGHWGNILAYHLRYKKGGKDIIFSPEGKLLGSDEKFHEGRPALYLGGNCTQELKV